jgi:hypothetical protein
LFTPLPQMGKKTQILANKHARTIFNLSIWKARNKFH